MNQTDVLTWSILLLVTLIIVISFKFLYDRYKVHISTLLTSLGAAILTVSADLAEDDQEKISNSDGYIGDGGDDGDFGW